MLNLIAVASDHKSPVLLLIARELRPAGKLIRMPVSDIRIAGRKTQGVILFRTAEGEKVVSVTWLDADAGDDEELEDETGSEVLGESVADADEDTEESSVEEPDVEAEE